MNQKNIRKREKSLMRSLYLLGVKPQPLSGAGWLKKEDGEGERVLVQLKSTEKESISIKFLDIETLIRNSIMIGKTPVFMIDFVQTNLQLVCFRADDLEKIARIILKDEESSPSDEEAKPTAENTDPFSIL